MSLAEMGEQSFLIVGFNWAQVVNIDVIGENIAAVNVIEKWTFNCRQFKFHILGSNSKFVIWMFDKTNVSHDIISCQSILLPLLYIYYMTFRCNCDWIEVMWFWSTSLYTGLNASQELVQLGWAMNQMNDTPTRPSANYLYGHKCTWENFDRDFRCAHPVTVIVMSYLGLLFVFCLYLYLS